MISVAKGASAGAVGAYFKQADYYTKNHKEAQGRWMGNGAKTLGLYGKVIDQEDFEKYLDGQFPGRSPMGRMVGGERQRTPGWDNTVSSPPAMSVAIEVFGDKTLSRIHDKSALETAKFIEAHSLAARQWDKEQDRQVSKKDQKGLIAAFRHKTSRNLDPSTHTHLFFVNAALGADNKWLSVDSQSSFYDQKMLHGIVFRSEEAYRTKSAGREIYSYTKDGKHYWDIKNVQKDISETFSSRSQDIKAHLGPGDHSAAKKAQAAQVTKRAKQTADISDLQKSWRSKVEGLGYDFETEKLKSQEAVSEISRRTPRAIYNHAISHLGEGNSVFSQDELLHAMLSRGLGDIRYPDANREIARAVRDKRLIVHDAGEANESRSLTTTDLQNAERKLIKLETSGRNSKAPILSRTVLNGLLAETTLNPSQELSLRQVVQSVSSVVGIQGLAGVGKSYTASRLVQTVETKGFKPIILAPSSSVKSDLAEDMQRKTQTLQSFLKRPEGGDKNIILLDEASMVGTNDMVRLLEIAETRNINRVILMGDKRQLSSVQAGSPFALLQEAGMRTSVIDNVIRQEDAKHQDMVRNAYSGEIDEALEVLDGDLREVGYENIDQEAVKEWFNKPDRKSVAIVASTNARIDRINTEVKERLKASGEVQKDGVDNRVYRSLNVSEADRKHIGNYMHADAVQFYGAYKPLGIKSNEIYQIENIDSDTGKVKLVGKDQKPILFTPEKSAEKMGSFSLLKETSMELGAGDKIMFTANSYKHKFDNKDVAHVLGVNDKQINLRFEKSGFEKRLKLSDPAMRFVKHAWAGTNHATQGKSVTGVVVAMSAHEKMTDQKSFYTAISRFKKNIKLFTDDKEQLRAVLKIRMAKPKHALPKTEIDGLKAQSKTMDKGVEPDRPRVKARTQTQDFGR